jgi:superfamily II RNA helicase
VTEFQSWVLRQVEGCAKVVFTPENETDLALHKFQLQAREIFDLLDKKYIDRAEANCGTEATLLIQQITATGGLSRCGEKILAESMRGGKAEGRSSIVVARERAEAILEIIRILDEKVVEAEVRIKQARSVAVNAVLDLPVI